MDTFLLRTPFDDLVLRAVRGGTERPSGDALELARRAARELRFGLDAGDPDVIDTAQRLDNALSGGGPLLRSPDPSLGFSAFLRALAERLENELLAGRLVVEQERIASLSDRRDLIDIDLPPLPPARPESNTHTFEVRFVDEIGKAISGIDAEFTADGAQTRPTNAAGIALLEGVQTSSATVAILDPEALSKALDPRWEKLRPGKPPKESNTTEVVFKGGELGPFALRAELPNTVVIKPPLGKLFVELWDKTGRVRHANRTYQIAGPQSFEGSTDDDGRLLHEDVFPGDYQLELTLKFFQEGDPDRQVEIVEGALIVLEPFVEEPQLRALGVVPRSVLARLRMFFNTNKAFLLPTALPSVRKLRALYLNNCPCEMLVVGHADTKGGTTFNDKLSLQRAQATVAYLKDDVEAWFKLYSADEPKQCWGKVEDHLMIISLADFGTKPKGENEVRWFQRTRKLQVDGDAGEETRKALIAEYMSLDGTSLEDFAREINATAHGCGENFPVDDASEELDQAPADEKRDPGDRRVELFLFDAEFGITPKPPGANSAAGSPEYPKWRERVVETVELKAGDPEAAQLTFVELSDAHFRTNSAVVLPEGEAPDSSGEHPALTAVGLIAALLRFNDEHPGRSLLVAGHTDSAASESFNQKLSEERAKVALGLLKGGADSRSAFGKLCNARHTTADIQQILSWISGAFGFNCDPGKIDGVAREEPVRNFQTAYNANKSMFNPDPKASNLDPDGAVGELTWCAFFDCYESALKDELGEDDAGLADLRAKVVFADPERESLGFGELFPIEELGVDEFRSQTNRRVELLFFEPSEEPDLAHAQNDPETSELYLPGRYDRAALKGTPTAKRPNQFDVQVRDMGGVVARLRLITDGGFEQVKTTDDAEPDDVDAGLFRVRFEKLPDLGLFSLFMKNADRQELVLFSELPFAALTGALGFTTSITPTEDIFDPSNEADDFDPDSYLSDYI